MPQIQLAVCAPRSHSGASSFLVSQLTARRTTTSAFQHQKRRSRTAGYRDRGTCQVAVGSLRSVAAAAVAAASAEADKECGGAASTCSMQRTADYVVVGSGVGGLSCAALLAKYGHSVIVCEAHNLPGGAAQTFERHGYRWDAGPSFFFNWTNAGSPSLDPLKNVLTAIGEPVDWVQYDRYMIHTPEGTFPCVCNPDAYADSILRMGGPQALSQWRQLEQRMAPLQEAAKLLPSATLRDDPGMVVTTACCGPRVLGALGAAAALNQPFSQLMDGVVTDPWLRSFLNFQCIFTNSNPATDTVCGAFVFMALARESGGAMEYPRGGSGAIVDALVRGIEKHGGQVLLHAPVGSILMDGGRAAGVQLLPGKEGNSQPRTILARKGVVSNASVWDTMRLLPPGAAPDWYAEKSLATPTTSSCLHMFLGINASGLPPDLDCHHIFLRSWENVEAVGSIVAVSIPSLLDPGMAPPGKASIHVYSAEPYELWEGLQRGSPEYKALKEERSQRLWWALEQLIPDVRQRAEVQLLGSPLTHARILHRHKGAFATAVRGGGGNLPWSTTPVRGLYRCGDTCMPGLGVPSAALTGMRCANSLVPLGAHLGLLRELGL